MTHDSRRMTHATLALVHFSKSNEVPVNQKGQSIDRHFTDDSNLMVEFIGRRCVMHINKNTTTLPSRKPIVQHYHYVLYF